MAKRSKINTGYISNPTVRLVQGGKPYFDLALEMIGQAVHSIHLQVYIFDDDSTGLMIANALQEAAKRKVKVYLMVDGYASQSLPGSFVEKLTHAGIQFRFFEPFFKNNNFYFGRRMHHKILVADASVALVGGLNIADRYNDTPEEPAWLDFALYVAGETAKELCIFCRNQWKGYLSQWPAAPCELVGTKKPADAATGVIVKISRNDWVLRKNQVSAQYLDMLRNATSRVTILSAYFLPGRMIRRQMVKAVKRGVSIRVITGGKSDVKVAKYAERWLYDWLLRKGIEVCEYQPTILHGKMAVCDDEWMTVGSYNINNISAYASLELNLSVKDAAFAKNTRQILEAIINKDCIPIDATYQHNQKNLLVKFIQWLSYQFIRTAFYLSTFYFRQKG
jgi:cardiolipin synthase A/B